MTEIKISPRGNFLMYQKEYTPDFVKKTIRKKNLNGLRIFADLEDQRVYSFEFLKEYDFLEGLEIASRDEDSYAFLKFLTKLKHLNLQNEGTIEIDLSNQINLESLSLQWRKSIVGMESCQKLKKLALVGYSEENLLPVKSVKNLLKLMVIDSKIKNLEGISGLAMLQHISLVHCKSLTSISELNKLQNLGILEFQTCPKIQDFELLSDLTKLESLQIIDCKIINSIKFMEKLPSLKKLFLSGNTEIEDGDLSPAKNIADVFITPMKHYNMVIQSKKTLD